jgi:MFS family permease
MDVFGSVFYAVTLFAVMYGFRLLPAVIGLWLIIGGVVCLAVFVVRENSVASPVLDLSLFSRNSVFALSNLSALINYAATFALSFLLSLFLQYIRGFTPRSAGLIMLTQPVMMAVFSPLAGRLSDRIEPRIVASAGMAMSTAGLLLTAFLGPGSSLVDIVAILMLCGLGFGLFSSPNTSAIMGSVEKKHYAVASATTGAMRLIGQMLSMGIAALVIAWYVGEVEITPERYSSFLSAFRTGFLVFSALCGVGIFASLFRGRVHGGSRQAPS